MFGISGLGKWQELYLAPTNESGAGTSTVLHSVDCCRLKSYIQRLPRGRGLPTFLAGDAGLDSGNTYNE